MVVADSLDCLVTGLCCTIYVVKASFLLGLKIHQSASLNIFKGHLTVSVLLQHSERVLLVSF